MGTAPASAREALDMVRAGLGYLAAADTGQLAAATQAECLRELEQADAVLTAARAFVLAGFTAGQGYADDADYSARSWLIHHTHITPGAAVGHTAWAKRTGTHPRVLAALAAGQVSESVGRLICLWTGKPIEAIVVLLDRTPGQPGKESTAASDLTPVMARLGPTELEIVDTLISAGIAPNRAEAIRWSLARISERPAYAQLRERTREIERLKSEF